MKKTITGVILIIIAVSGIIGWEMFGREELMFSEVLVLNKNTEAYTVITEDMLASRKIYQPMNGAYTRDDIDKIIGMMTTQYIPVGSELYDRFFKNPELNVSKDEGEYVFSVSVQNLISYPRSIAKGDSIYIYTDDARIMDSTVLSLKDSSGNEICQSDDRTKVTGQINSMEIKADEEEVKILLEYISDGYPIAIAYN